MSAQSSARSDLALVLITGSHTSPIWRSPVITRLNKLDYPQIVAPPNLSACPANEQRFPTPILADDALYVRETLQALLQRGKDIVMVMASYGGLPGTEALAGLPSRDKLGGTSADGEGAIVRLTTTVTHDLWTEGVFEGKVMYIIGEKGEAVRPRVAENMNAKAEGQWKRNIAVKRFADDGHAMMITRADYVADAIEEMVDSLT